MPCVVVWVSTRFAFRYLFLTDRVADLQLIGRLKQCISTNHRLIRELGREMVDVGASLDAVSWFPVPPPNKTCFTTGYHHMMIIT